MRKQNSGCSTKKNHAPLSAVVLVFLSLVNQYPVWAVSTSTAGVIDDGAKAQSTSDDASAETSPASKSDTEARTEVTSESKGDKETEAAEISKSDAEAGAEAKSTTETKEDSQAITAQAGNSGQANLTVDEVKIEGNRLVPTEDIMGVVKTKRGDRFDRDVVMQDLKAINNMGYFDDRNLQVVPELTTGGVLLKIRVQENAPVTEFSFQGNQVLSSEDISKVFTQQLGKPQNLTHLSSAIDKVEQAYHERGYMLARVTDVKDDPDGSVGLNINEGIIDKIEIVGNKKTKDFIIRNAIKMKPGVVYNERDLTADLRKLYANGYFQDIRRSLAPSTENPDHYVLKVEVDEKRTGSVGVGGGVDTIAGPFGSFTVGDNNFRGRGQVLSFTSQVGTGMFGSVNNALNNGGNNFVANQRTYQVEASFIEPHLAGTNTSMAVTGFGRDLNSFMIEQAMQRTLGASVNFSRSLGHNLHADLGFTGEDVALKDVSNLYTSNNILGGMIERAMQTGQAQGPAAYNLAESVRKNQLAGGAYLSVNPTLRYDTRDAPIDPTKGTLIKLSATPSMGLTGAGFAKFGLSASKFVKVTENTTLATNIQAGTALGNVPQFAQYWMGGFNGVRGYRSFTDLGTGTSMLMATAEMRTHLPFLHNSDSKLAKTLDKHLKGVVFFDAGQVSGNSATNSLLSRGGLGASTGLGLRINVPMLGLIRVDYGMPLISTLLGRMTPRVTIGFGDKF